MPEIINSLFGRTRNTTDGSGGEVDPTVTMTMQPTGDATATGYVAEVVETAPAADDVVETTEGESSDQTPADSDAEDAAESADVDGQTDDEPAADEVEAEESGEAVTDEYPATDEDTAEEAATEIAGEDGDLAEDVEPAEAEADETPVADETTDDDVDDAADADDTDDADDADADDVDADDTDEDAADAADDVDDADDADQAEPVVVPVAEEARPAAGARGSVTVGEGVVGKVVNIVVGKIDGVHSLDDEGTSVEVDDDVATIKISFVVEYGHAIKALAERIRIDVIEAVEQFLGLDVAAVDVHVSDIHAG